MELFRSLLAFFMRNLDIIAIVLLTIAIIKLNLDIDMQKRTIDDLQTQVESINKETIRY